LNGKRIEAAPGADTGQCWLALHRGMVVERGPTARVLDDPQDPYTPRLRASVPRPGWKPRRRALTGAGEEPEAS
jgi:ABC-type glutathione transport system ATPase component